MILVLISVSCFCNIHDMFQQVMSACDQLVGLSFTCRATNSFIMSLSFSLEDVSLTVSLLFMCDNNFEVFDTMLVSVMVAESKAPCLAFLTITSITLPLLSNPPFS